MSFPREENMQQLVGSRRYSDGIRWRVFKDLDDTAAPIGVLIITDRDWTVLNARDFRALVERILPQLEQ